MAQTIFLFNATNLQSVAFTGPGQVSGVADSEAFALIAAGMAVITGREGDD